MFIYLFSQANNTKYMKASEIIDIKNLIKSNIVKGDYITLGKMLDVEHTASRMRFNRNNEEAVLAMKEIIDNRDQLIKNYKSRQMVKTINGLPDGFAVLDCVAAKTGRLVMVVITNYKNHETVFPDVNTMDANCHQYIKDVLKHDKVTSIITDCHLGYLPKVVETIKALGIKQFYHHEFASRSESIMQLVHKRY